MSNYSNKDSHSLLLKKYKESENSLSEGEMRFLEPYKELNNFRQQVEVHPMGFQLYTRAKRRVFKYRTTFALLALIFAFLGLIVTWTTPSYPLIIGMSTFFTARNLIVGIAMAMGLGSAICAYILSPAKEAAMSVLKHNQRHLKRHYNRKKIDWHVAIPLLGKPCKKGALLQQKYSDIQNKLVEKHEEVVHLLERISHTESLKESVRERLYNQALHEFVDKGRDLVHTFSDLKLPYEGPSD